MTSVCCVLLINTSHISPSQTCPHSWWRLNFLCHHCTAFLFLSVLFVCFCIAVYSHGNTFQVNQLESHNTLQNDSYKKIGFVGHHCLVWSQHKVTLSHSCKIGEAGSLVTIDKVAAAGILTTDFLASLHLLFYSQLFCLVLPGILFTIIHQFFH